MVVGLEAAYRELDKIIVSVASAVLALSITFIGGLSQPKEIWSIKTSWALPFAAVLFVFVSLLFEQTERLSRIDRIDDAIQEQRFAFRDRAGKHHSTINCLNSLSSITFMAGLFLLAFFLHKCELGGIMESNQMSKEPKTDETRGVPPVSSPPSSQPTTNPKKGK